MSDASHEYDPCRCTYPGCPRHGDCRRCVAYHRPRHEVPGCYFSAQGERKYDRTLAHCLRDRGLGQ